MGNLVTRQKTIEYELLNSQQLALTDFDQLLDTSCIKEDLLFGLKSLNASMINERLYITLFEYNQLVNERRAVGQILEPFSSIGKMTIYNVSSESQYSL